MPKSKHYELTTIKANGDIETKISIGQPSLNTLQQAVHGYIERIEVEFGGHKWCDMWVNEEGLLQGLPCNKQATELVREYSRFYPKHDPNVCIVGDVIIVRPVKEPA